MSQNDYYTNLSNGNSPNLSNGYSQNVTNGCHRNVALITGITGQDGSYLAELLLRKGYEVHGVVRRTSSLSAGRLKNLLLSNGVTPDAIENGHSTNGSSCNVELHQPIEFESRDAELNDGVLKLHYGDMTDSFGLQKLISDTRPDEVYNLAAQSNVKLSFDLADYTTAVCGIGVLHLLDAIRQTGLAAKTRFFQASTGELFGRVREVPQRESTPFGPRSPYACAKQLAHNLVVTYREGYGMFACNGIMFCHESPRRGEIFVTRKISRAVAAISLGRQQMLELGNLDTKRDWGHSRDYVEAMWRMLQHDQPDDYVIASGSAHTIRDFTEAAFRCVGTELKWEGLGLGEVGRDAASGAVRVKVNPRYVRKGEDPLYLGDTTKAMTVLGWKPKCNLEQLVKEMVMNDVELMKKDCGYTEPSIADYIQ